MANPDVNSVLRSQDFYRLKTAVQSAGSIYEVDVSARSIFIGPDSDIAEVRIQYADPDQPLSVQTADISVNGPFVGGVQVDLNAELPSTMQPARILASPVDIVNNAYSRNTAGPVTPARRYNLPVVLDLIFALETLPAIPAVRADRTFRLSQVPFEDTTGPGNGSTDIVIPVYGRRMITVQFVTNLEFQADFYLVALQPGQSPDGKFLGSLLGAAISTPINYNAVIKASDSVDQVDGTSSLPSTYTEVDVPLPSVKGMADLLVINISTASAIAGLRFIDCFVKLSDREA